MALTYLEPLSPGSAAVDRPPEAYLPMQEVTRQIAFEEGGWHPERMAKVTELFDGLAAEWHSRGGAERLAPTRDALERGGAPAGGRALEVGSGTGIQTEVLRSRFDAVLSVDLSSKMLARAPRRAGVLLLRADASRLPLKEASVEAVVCVNAYLFPAECARVLVPGGRVVFVSTSGASTPIYLPPEDVVAALAAVAEVAEATTSCCGSGSWTVVALGR